MTRRMRWALFLLGILFARPAGAQLRPWEPFDWSLFDGASHANVAIGTSVLWEQRASLAGTEGVLVEAGTFSGGYRNDRIGIEGGGTLYRHFREKTSFAPPVSGTEARPLGTRRDNGDYRISTGILITPPDRPAAFLFRFGTRLPSTDNVVGLDRDATDFFATIGGRADFSFIRAFTELGVGVHGTRLEDYEQVDVLLYMVGLEARSGFLRPAILFLGQTVHPRLQFRGTEPLSEIRLRLHTPGRVSLRVDAIHGLADFSPAAGVSISLVGTL